MNEVASTFGLGFGLTIGIILFTVTVIGLLIAKTLRRVVEPNEVHIVQSRSGSLAYGKVPNATGNAYYAWPSWWPVIGVQTVVLPLSVFDMDLSDYEAYDIGKVPFVVDVVAFFRIAQPTVAAERVLDLNELQCQLKSILQGAVRTILAKHEVEEIMMERSTFGKLFTEETKDQLLAWGVENVKNIELMDIRDGAESRTISNIMAKKESLIDMQSRTEVAENSRLAQVAEIEAQRDVDVQAQVAEQKVGERTAEKDKIVGVANEQAKQEVKEQAKTTAVKEMAIQQVKEVRAAEIEKDVQVVNAGLEKETVIIKAEGNKTEKVIIAEGELTKEQLNGKGILAVGSAEAEAKRLLEMSTVDPQIALATEIGENEGYQTYLISLRGVEKDEVVGVEQAKALQDAEIKVISNTGDVTTGVTNVMDLLSTKGGTAFGGAVEALANTEQGAAILKRLGVTLPAGTTVEAAPGNGAA